MKTVFLAAAVSLSLVACARSTGGQRPASEKEIELVRAGMVELLKDPDSALFRDVTIREDEGTVCGKVNAKNGFGSYAGYTTFSGSYLPAGDRGPAVFDEPRIAILTVDTDGRTNAADMCARTAR